MSSFASQSSESYSSSSNFHPYMPFGFFRRAAELRSRRGGGDWRYHSSSGQSFSSSSQSHSHIPPSAALISMISVSDRIQILQSATPELVKRFHDTSTEDEVDTRDDEEEGIQSLLGHLCSLIYCIFLELGYAFRLSTRFVLVAFLFGPVMLSFPFWYFSHLGEIYDGLRPTSLWWVHYLVWAFETSGPTFTKLGQWASSRSDLFPPYVCEILGRLQANVRAHSMQDTRRIIRNQYGLDLEDIFETFDPEPIGVGAIAQVYKATVLPAKIQKLSKTPHDTKSPESLAPISCAVKVLHPGVESKIHSDVTIMRTVAQILHSVIPGAEWLSLPEEVDVFGSIMKEQLDLRLESANLEQFNRNFENHYNIAFPLPIGLPSRRQILVETFVDSIPVMKFLTWPSIFDDALADYSIDTFLRMLLLDNFVHADLHPGNIHVTFKRKLKRPSIFFTSSMDSEGEGHEEEVIPPQTLARLCRISSQQEWVIAMEDLKQQGYSPCLVFLDTGLVSVLSPRNMVNFLDLFSAIANFDGSKVAALMIERSRLPQSVKNPEAFKTEMTAFLRHIQLQTLQLSKIHAGELLGKVLAMVRNHHIKIEGDFVNVAISIMLLEGMARQLNPSMDLLKRSVPVLRVAATKNASPQVQAVAGSVFWRVWLYSLVAGFITHGAPREDENMFATDVGAGGPE